MIDKKLKFVGTSEGIFEVGEEVTSRTSDWEILGFSYLNSKLRFHVRSTKRHDSASSNSFLPTGNWPYLLSSGEPQFSKMPQPKKLSKYKEPSGLYFDRKIGFEKVEADE